MYADNVKAVQKRDGDDDGDSVHEEEENVRTEPSGKDSSENSDREDETERSESRLIEEEVEEEENVGSRVFLTARSGSGMDNAEVYSDKSNVTVEDT